MWFLLRITILIAKAFVNMQLNKITRKINYWFTSGIVDDKRPRGGSQGFRKAFGIFIYLYGIIRNLNGFALRSTREQIWDSNTGLVKVQYFISSMVDKMKTNIDWELNNADFVSGWPEHLHCPPSAVSSVEMGTAGIGSYWAVGHEFSIRN